MDLTSKKEIRKALGNKHPSKKLGQNFLIDDEVIEDLISVAKVDSKDRILEIGPGVGALTSQLSKKAEEVLAVEKDEFLYEHLKNLGIENLTLFNDDFLDLNTEIYSKKEYKSVSNLPFNVAGPIIKKLLKERSPSIIVAITQKEVADRIESKGEKENFLSIITKFRGEPKVIKRVPRSSFWPSPGVDGAIIKITPHQKYPREDFPEEFFRLVEVGFLHPRKQIKNNLSHSLSKKEVLKMLSITNIDPKKRPEDLLIDEWVSITKTYLTLKRKENKINQDES